MAFLELLQDDNLVDVLPGKPVRGQHDNGVDQALVGKIPETVQAGADKVRAAVAVVDALLKDLV